MEAHRLVVAVADVIWVGRADGAPVDAVSAAAMARRLGTTVDAVVLDLHDGFDGDTLGRAHGLVRGGGVLVLRLPDGSPSGRMGRWLEFQLLRARGIFGEWIPPASWTEPAATPDQDALVAALADALEMQVATVSVVVADRGRGKSAGLGRALAAVAPSASVVVTGPHPRAVEEVLRFSGRPDLRYRDPLDLLADLEAGHLPAVVVVDEAAQLPVPLLRALYRSAPGAHFVFATTTHGYEGSGRGFSLRFVPWLATQPRSVRALSLSSPIRWSAGDPLERWVFDVLVLDSTPADGPRSPGPPRVEVLDRDRLLQEPGLLQSVFGLLVAAHYRTTPADLHHLLDDPDVALHVVWEAARVVAVGWLVADGGLDAPMTAAVARGQRLRGFALAESFVCHAGRPEAARLRMWRSVRTAVHPELRGRGLARLLISHEHEHHGDADLIGTLFGATEGLVRMRQALGYEVVRLGVSRSARSGVPSVMMVRPMSTAARELVAVMRADLARDLPAVVGRLDAERGVPLADGLVSALSANLPEPSSWNDGSVTDAMARYVDGATPIDALADAPRRWLRGCVAWQDRVGPLERCALESRILRDDPWHIVAQKCGARSIPVVQRAVRRGCVAVWEAESK